LAVIGCQAKIGLSYLMKVEAIIFKSGFQTFKQVRMCIYTRGYWYEVYESSSMQAAKKLGQFALGPGLLGVPGGFIATLSIKDQDTLIEQPP